ncbi:hypothetical protein NDU88_007297 [Pleurodeles waltl]|uniref:Uncharacterized protein n=1 Tax=Pleurodeles waltl TaxID=8319 RepID=A0AAV7NUJ4_PLEWA|nr:hypothetical protein NDU88_007297 [Pleurodeles waltl]
MHCGDGISLESEVEVVHEGQWVVISDGALDGFLQDDGSTPAMFVVWSPVILEPSGVAMVMLVEGGSMSDKKEALASASADAIRLRNVGRAVTIRLRNAGGAVSGRLEGRGVAGEL